MILQLLVGLVVICLVFWAAQSILGAFGLGEPVTTLVRVVLVVLVVLWLVSLLGYLPSGLGRGRLTP